MSAQIGDRPVLRPAGNVALRHHNGDARAIPRKTSKPPPSPVKPAPLLKTSPPNSQPSTPGAALPPCRSPLLKPNPSCKHSPPPRCPQQTTSGEDSVHAEPIVDMEPLPSISLDPLSLPREPASNSARTTVSKSSNFGAARQRKIVNPHISFTKSSADVFQKDTSNAKTIKPRTNISKLGSLSLDETSLTNIMAAKKAAASELNAQKKLRVAEYGRKQGKASRIVPEIASLSPVSVELKRCKFITAQTDPLYVAYHDEEWGVPVHDDRMLFELLVLAGAQVELSWSSILSKRDAYRSVFSGFDPAAVSMFNEKRIQSLEADRSLSLPGGKIRGVVENAQRILEVIDEYGSLDKYFWGFLNYIPMVNSYRYPKQVPVKTSKSDLISKDLVRRGFRFVGPTIVYSFMQAAGMTNDHLVQCFRHQECVKLCSSEEEVTREQEEQKQCFREGECEIFAVDQEAQLQQEQSFSDQEPQAQQEQSFSDQEPQLQQEQFFSDQEPQAKLEEDPIQLHEEQQQQFEDFNFSYYQKHEESCDDESL